MARGQTRGLPSCWRMPSTASGSTTTKAWSPRMRIDLDDLGFDRGGHLLVARALAGTPVGADLRGRGARPAARAPSRHVVSCTWSRVPDPRLGRRNRGAGPTGPARRRAMGPSARAPEARRRRGLIARPPAEWGLAARGALVEAGGPTPRFDARRARPRVGRHRAPPVRAGRGVAVGPRDRGRLGCAGRASRRRRGRGGAGDDVPRRERAGCARGAGSLPRPVHPHFREVVQLLAVQVADEARHVEVFTRRAAARDTLGVRRGGRASLQTLLDEPDFTLAGFLLSVLGEGTFLNLLSFLGRPRAGSGDAHGRAPRVAGRGSPRRLRPGAPRAPPRRPSPSCVPASGRPSNGGTTRCGTPRGSTSACSTPWSCSPPGRGTRTRSACGYDRVRELQDDMDEGRRRRLGRLGFPPGEAAELSALHTRNFM